MAVRLKDIARDLGVSLITVSKALRGMEDISEETRQRVLKRMAELNYRPNMLARGLASGKSYIVGLVVPDLLHPFFAEFAKALNGVLRRHSYGLILASSEEDAQIEQQEIRNLLARGVDALLIASCQPTLQGFYGIEDQRKPYILIDRNFPHLCAHFVGTDDYAAGLAATRHLISTGKRRIAHIAGPELAPGLDRLRGYKDALQEAGFVVRKSYIISNSRVEELGEDVGCKVMQKLLQKKPRPDAVFCYNDLTAIGAIHATLEAGLSIPGEIAFVGCGNVRYSDYLRVPLSSIDQSTVQLGEQAGKLALDLIGKRVTTPKHIRVEPKLVIRASSVGATAKPSQASPRGKSGARAKC
ncbi:MAG TPA: LacI family DNA-binding transcriptional regulator [Acidobacteriaceae bacterium]|nr:LacI family DNA-binding transcriptional regulator [Acidobacteriaceae bacterium]